MSWWHPFLGLEGLCRAINHGYNWSLEFTAVNSQLAGLLEEGEHQPPTKDRPHDPQREFWLQRLPRLFRVHLPLEKFAQVSEIVVQVIS